MGISWGGALWAAPSLHLHVNQHDEKGTILVWDAPLPIFCRYRASEFVWVP